MTSDNDGVALTSMAHPRPVWWKRPWYWLRTLRGIRRSSLVSMGITIKLDEDGRSADSARSILNRSRR